MAICKTCGAEIIFITTKKGKKHPVNAKPVKMWVQDPMSVDLHNMILIDVYESHFATCPDADMHRTRSDGKKTLEQKLRDKIVELEVEINRYKQNEHKHNVDFDAVNKKLQLQADADMEA